MSHQCLHHSPCPIAVVHGHHSGHGHEPERIVVGVDGSTHAQRALAWAVDAACQRGATVDVVHAWHYPPWGPPPHGAPGLTYANFQRFEELSRDVLDHAVEQVDVSGLARRPERVLVCGGAARAVLDTAKGADLVVVGARGQGGFSRLLLGSVSHQVATHAECPVVVIPPQG